jgi:thiosulfate/3-mercaptopyruvate sulfurtransferase
LTEPTESTESTEWTESEYLIGIDELHARLDDPEIRIADTHWYLGEPEKGPAAFAARHLPGAVYVHMKQHMSATLGPGRSPLPDRETFARTMDALGFGDEHLVVAYDDRGGAVAARLWWMLRDIGHDRVRVLDGGITAWMEAGYPVTTETVLPPAARMSIHPGPTRQIDRAALLARLGEVVLLDARDPERYRGEYDPYDAVAGHIPTARSAHVALNLGPDERFLEPNALAARFSALGVPDGEVVAYCGGGVTACHNILSILIAGFPEPTLYPGSWSDWVEARYPVATGAEPGTL